MIVNVHAAKTQLSKLLERAEAGEEIIIARSGKPVARLAPLNATLHGVAEEAAPFGLGTLRGRIWMAPEVDADWQDEDWQETIRQMEEGPIFPSIPEAK
jgi:prevent-host-death family protein